MLSKVLLDEVEVLVEEIPQFSVNQQVGLCYRNNDRDSQVDF